MKPLHLEEEISFGLHLKIILVGYPFIICDQSRYPHLAAYHVAFGTKTRFSKAWY
jgi:hypothetical protein